MNKKSRSGAKPNPGWFRKGQSGNSNGRPSAFRPPRASALDVIVGKTLTVAHGSSTREITVAEALQQRTYRDAVAGKRMAQREVLKWIMKREAWLVKHSPHASRSTNTHQISPDPDNADAALCSWGSQQRIPHAPTLAPTGRSSSLSLGRLRRLSAAGAAAIA